MPAGCCWVGGWHRGRGKAVQARVARTEAPWVWLCDGGDGVGGSGGWRQDHALAGEDEVGVAGAETRPVVLHQFPPVGGDLAVGPRDAGVRLVACGDGPEVVSPLDGVAIR